MTQTLIECYILKVPFPQCIQESSEGDRAYTTHHSPGQTVVTGRNSRWHKNQWEKGSLGRTRRGKGVSKTEVLVKAWVKYTFWEHEIVWCIWSIGGSEEMKPEKTRRLETDLGSSIIFTRLGSVVHSRAAIKGFWGAEMTWSDLNFRRVILATKWRLD